MEYIVISSHNMTSDLTGTLYSSKRTLKFNDKSDILTSDGPVHGRGRKDLLYIVSSPEMSY